MDNRRPNGKFGPGNCANPTGRPKVADEFRAKARKAVDEHVLDAWIDEVTSRGKEWAKCSELLAAYGYGKPSQPLEHSTPDGSGLEVRVSFVKPEEGK